jgi:hypothetical protein
VRAAGDLAYDVRMQEAEIVAGCLRVCRSVRP